MAHILDWNRDVWYNVRVIHPVAATGVGGGGMDLRSCGAASAFCACVGRRLPTEGLGRVPTGCGHGADAAAIPGTRPGSRAAIAHPVCRPHSRVCPLFFDTGSPHRRAMQRMAGDHLRQPRAGSRARSLPAGLMRDVFTRPLPSRGGRAPDVAVPVCDYVPTPVAVKAADGYGTTGPAGTGRFVARSGQRRWRHGFESRVLSGWHWDAVAQNRR